jgi:cation:H+ antiporter
VDPLTLGLFVAGAILLILGAELLVRGASALSRNLGLSPLVIGLTVVAYATSAPELAVSVLSRLQDRPDVGVGNIIGSNIFNVMFVLGLSALVAPLAVSMRLVRFEVPLLVVASLAILLMASDGVIGTFEGALLFGSVVLYTAFTVIEAKLDGDSTEAGSEAPRMSVPPSVLLVLAGLGLLVLGSNWLIDGASELARELGLSELIIGLTIVAAGTSFPELATTVVAAFRGERDMAVGNVIGSSIFNLLAVLGLTAVVMPGGIGVSDPARYFDLPVMTAVAVACLPIFFTGQLVARWEGALFLLYWAAYLLYLFLDATGHDALEEYSLVMLLFVLPLTAFTLGYLFVVALRRRLDGAHGDTLP